MNSSSSSSSTLTYESAHEGNGLMSDSSVVSTSSRSSEIRRLGFDDSFTTDSTIDNLTDIVIDELAKAPSCLYDIKADITMELPKFEIFNKPDMLRATVYLICGDIAFKYEKWKSLAPLLAYQLGRALNPTTGNWIPVKDKRLLFHGKANISGHTDYIDETVFEPPIVYDTLNYHDYICATNVKLHYSAEVFISPAIAGAEGFYNLHGFISDVNNYFHKKKHMDDIVKEHKREKLKTYDHHLAWATVYNVIQGYRDNVVKQNVFLEDYGFPF